METLRCPTCLGGPLAGGEKRCPACRARIRTGARRADAGDRSGAPPRPLLLVERELQARIEAETASSYWQRRRAAKVARRIAALPPTLFGKDVADAERDSRASQAAYVSPIIVDLPDSAVHYVSSTSTVVDHEPDVVIEVDVESDVIESDVMVVDPELFDEIDVPVPEAVAEPAAAEAVVEAVAEPAAVEPAVEPVVEVIVQPVVEAVEPAFEPVGEVVVEPVVEVEPDFEEEPVAEPDLVAAAVSPRPVNAVWVDRVFNSATRAPQLATWPRPRTPVARGTDV